MRESVSSSDTKSRTVLIAMGTRETKTAVKYLGGPAAPYKSTSDALIALSDNTTITVCQNLPGRIATM